MRILLLAFLLCGCAENRYLSKEEDAAMREACEAAGCAIVPSPLWEHIKQRLSGTSI